MKDKKAVFLGVARNCAADLGGVLANIERISELFADQAFIFVENDSKDATKTILQSWCANRHNARTISLDGLVAQTPMRTVRLAHCRNILMSIAKTEFSDFDYALMIDCDNINSNLIDLSAMRRAVGFLEQTTGCAGVFANSAGIYYDLWALRHPTLCPGDIWEEMGDYVISNKVTDERAFDQFFKPRLLTISPDEEPIEVDSAFGGLGIYKFASLLRNTREYIGQKLKTISVGGAAARNVGWEVCDHVAFNMGLRERGEKLVLLPYLTNVNTATFEFLPSFWRSLSFDIKRNQPCPCNSGKRYKHCHGALS